MRRSCADFYEHRDRRTRQYDAGWVPSDRWLGIVPAPSVLESVTGQLLLLALLNQAARTQRRIAIELPATTPPVVVATPCARGSLTENVIALARSIDPCGEFQVVDRIPDDAVSIGLGPVRENLLWYLGVDGWIGELNRVPVAVDPAGTWGAAMASILGASAAFREIAGLTVGPARISAWSWSEGADIAQGPSVPPDPNVGRVLSVGAGAVGIALAYWRLMLGHAGEWLFVDKDVVKLHNTNRGLAFFPGHAGWPTGSAQAKARVAADLLPAAKAFEGWYDEFTRSSDARRPFDLVLPLANERDVRAAIASLSQPVVLHATTSENWGAFLHRHIAGRDDCITCRLRDVPVPAFECSTGIVGPPAAEGDASPDAALPFLSAAAGLMLASALARLSAGELDATGLNAWALDLRSAYRVAIDGRYRCREGCRTVLPDSVRSAVPGGRWAGIDPARRS